MLNKNMNKSFIRQEKNRKLENKMIYNLNKYIL